MEIVNIQEVQADLARFLTRTAHGETVIISHAGQPVAKLIPMEASTKPTASRLGFLKGALQIPEDFDEMGKDSIEAMFNTDGKS
ncbi:type II toxin-antitoxin system prevent-host-death family antitoxin [Halomonas alkaliantarctica]|nr:type II toxin-antitoxin system prevent-host-death family antitoxin [Halomonas alkaliantarctica]